MGADKLVDDSTEHFIDSSEAAIRRSNPEFGELSDEVRLSLVWHVVRKLPSNRPSRIVELLSNVHNETRRHTP
jgi:hypothetical protein